MRENIDQELARLVYERWGNDLPAAAVAWRRLYQNNCSDNEFKKLVDGGHNMRELTETQRYVLYVLRERGASWSASAAEENWRSGRAAFFDDRNAAVKGLIRKILRANREATANLKTDNAS